nr:transcription termination/antitermination protein NusA [Hyphomicrobiales bacterium]
PGITKSMLVSLGESDVRKVEDFADCATDDLLGWTEKKNGEVTRHSGYLTSFDLTREDAEQMILNARIHAGWIEAAPEPEEESGETAEIDEAEPRTEVEEEASKS